MIFVINMFFYFTESLDDMNFFLSVTKNNIKGTVF